MNVDKILFVLTTSVVTCLGAAASGAGTPEKPNVVFIMVDDLGKDWIGCYGADEIRTPNIDRLAEGGMKFHNAWSMPQCTPTRVTLLTGQYPWRTGWVNHWDVPRWGVGYFDWERYVTVATIMRSAGYKTAVAGKWQINDFRVEPEALQKHGFDDWCMWTGYEAQNPPSGKRYWDPYIHTLEGSKTYQGRFGPDVYCDFLVDFIRKHRDEPMMVYFPLALTHGPLVHTPHEPDVTDKREKHQAMVRYTDHLVGRVVKALDELEVRDRTSRAGRGVRAGGAGDRRQVAGAAHPRPGRRFAAPVDHGPGPRGRRFGRRRRAGQERLRRPRDSGQTLQGVGRHGQADRRTL